MLSCRGEALHLGGALAGEADLGEGGDGVRVSDTVRDVRAALRLRRDLPPLLRGLGGTAAG